MTGTMIDYKDDDGRAVYGHGTIVAASVNGGYYVEASFSITGAPGHMRQKKVSPTFLSLKECQAWIDKHAHVG